MNAWLSLSPDLITWCLRTAVCVALLGLVALSTLRFYRTASPHWRHALAVNVLLASLALPFIPNASLGLPVFVPTGVSEPEDSAASQIEATTGLSPARSPSEASSPIGPQVAPRLKTRVFSQRVLQAVLNLGAAAWLIGALFMLVQTLYWFVQQHRLLRRGTPVKGRRAQQFANLAKRRCIRQPIQLLSLDHAPWPFTVGVLRPIVVVPTDLLHVSPRRMEAVLTHELEHVRRRDYAILLIQRAYAILYWWNPCRRYFDEVLETARERICDDAVLADQGDGAGLARYLVRSLARTQPLPAWSSASLGAGDGQLIKSRVQHLMIGEPSMIRLRKLTLFALAAVILAASVGLAQLAPAQTLRWVRQEGDDDMPWRSTAVFADGLGSVYMVGGIGSIGSNGTDAYLAKYNDAGDRQWSQRYDVLGRYELLNDVAADNLGNVYAAGVGRASAPDISEADAIVAKFDSDGTMLWERQLGVNNAFVESYEAMVVDDEGNLYAGGSTTDRDGDALLAKYSPDGDIVWTRQWGTNFNDSISSVSADGLGSFYAAGWTQGDLGAPSSGGADGFVRKFDSDGEVIWTRQLGTPEIDRGRGVAADANGNVFVAGDTRGALGESNAGDYDGFLARFDADGDLIWTRQFGTGAFDRVWDVATDGLGNAYVSGWTRGGEFGGTTSSNDDAFVTMFSADGKQLWTRYLATPLLDQVRGVSADGQGNLYVSGYTNGSLGPLNAAESDLFLAKYSVVPEPGAMSLLALGGVFFVGVGRLLRDPAAGR